MFQLLPTPGASLSSLTDSNMTRVVALLVAWVSLASCSTAAENVSEKVIDWTPKWMGGLPKDAPPRPGTPEYDELQRKQEAERAHSTGSSRHHVFTRPRPISDIGPSRHRTPIVCHFSLAAQPQKAFETAVEQYPKMRIRLRNRALKVMQEHLPK